ncbi:MAG: hypothetical protein Fur0037_18810 [Planctomycetota bacterium]
MLAPSPFSAVVHWAVATPVLPSDAAPGLEALPVACARASLFGTFPTGSSDEASEREALEVWNRALRIRHATKTGTPEWHAADEQVRRAEAAAAAAGDPRAFRRVLAAAPASDLRIAAQWGCLVLELTTTDEALERVARLLVERRDRSALRGFEREFEIAQRAARARWDSDPFSPLNSEALALAFAGHPLAEAGIRPPDIVPERAEAVRAWLRSQRPERTVIALVGSFDPLGARRRLESVFEHPLPFEEPATKRMPSLPPLNGVRRSLVPGEGSACVVGWRLDGTEDPLLVESAAAWLGGELARRLREAKEKSIAVSCRAPWPHPSGPGLFLIQARKPDAGAGSLADRVLALCDGLRAPAVSPRPGHRPGALVRAALLSGDNAALARSLALDALLAPKTASGPPPRPDDVRRFFEDLRRRSPAVIVERGVP